MAVCLAWQAGIGSLFAKPGFSNAGAGIAGIASMFCFSAAFSVSFGPVSWIYQSEVFSMPLRAMGTSISTCSNCELRSVERRTIRQLKIRDREC
jgi:hypothetical protein